MIFFIVAKGLGLTHGLLFLFKPPWKSSHGKLWIMHMTYAACLSEGTEEPDSNLHFWSCSRDAGNFRQEFLGLWGQTEKSSERLQQRWELDGEQRMEHRAGLKWNIWNTIQLMPLQVHKDVVFFGMVKLGPYLKNLEEQTQNLLVVHVGKCQ